ncbi:MAG: choice-of-anchor D domain-containing protein [Bacteroidetes bacterium]|nr:choice-of-anchor D domain-containing protein [Bacteroidota bacterium]
MKNPTGTPNYTYPGTGLALTTAGRLDETGDYIQVFVGGQMGASTYYLAGTGTSWQGTFKVRESADGSAWTDIATYTNNLTSTLTQYTVTPSAPARYIRWEFTNKITGFNVKIEDINITAGVSTAADINMKYNTTSVLSGGTTPIFGSPVGTPTALNFVVENTGLSTLTVNSISFTGTDAGDFSVTSPVGSFTVAATSNVPLVVSFNPSASGTRVADMIIANDDSDEGSYVIHLNAVGGNLASEPTGIPSGLNFTNVKSYRAVYSFNAASGNPDGYIIIRKTSNTAITDVPVDGVTYQRGDAVGGSEVVSVGTGLSNTLMNVWAGTQYQLAIFPYNGADTYINYNTEYSTVSTSSASFLTQLQAKINPHSSVFYSNYANTMVKLFEAYDTTAGQSAITCAYSGYKALYTGPLSWSNTDFSREHTYCHNWMPTNPADNPELPEYNDQHHIYPTKFIDVNEVRSNYPLAEVVTPNFTFMGCKFGANALGKAVFEPQ